MSIKKSILLPVIAALTIGILLMVALVGYVFSKSTTNLTERLVSARVSEYSNKFQVSCLDSYGSINALAPVLLQLSETAANPRQEVVNVLSEVLMADNNIVEIWSCWEPNAFDNQDSLYANTPNHDATGRYIPCIYKTENTYGVKALDSYNIPGEGDFYLTPLSTRKPHITDPFYYERNGEQTLIYSIAMPIIKDGRVLGVVGADILLADLITMMNQGSILNDGYLFVLSPSGMVASHRTESLLLTHYSSTWMNSFSAQLEDALRSGSNFSAKTYSDVINSDIRFLASGVMIGDTGRYWGICGVVPEKTVTADSVSLTFLIIAVGLALIASVGFIIFFIVRARLRQLPILTATAEAMAKGKIDTGHLPTDTEPTKNEIDILGRAFSAMTKSIQEQASVMSQIAQGDYSVTLAVRSEDDVVNKAINDMLRSTNDVMREVRRASEQVSAGSRQISQASQDLAVGTSEQAATIEEFTAGITEVQEKSKEIAAIASESQIEINEAGRLMVECTEAMTKMTHTMKSIDTGSQNIASIIKVIEDIAFQTNILALNAAVEAARAGQHGKGFSVVADEVRNLASKSAEAAKETASLIESSLLSVSEGNGMVCKVNESIEAVAEIASKNATSIGKMNESSQAQSQSMAMIASGINEISNVVQANSATSEETAASAEEMSSQAEVLSSILSRFKLNEQSGYPIADMYFPQLEAPTGADKYQ